MTHLSSPLHSISQGGGKAVLRNSSKFGLCILKRFRELSMTLANPADWTQSCCLPPSLQISLIPVLIQELNSSSLLPPPVCCLSVIKCTAKGNLIPHTSPTSQPTPCPVSPSKVASLPLRTRWHLWVVSKATNPLCAEDWGRYADGRGTQKCLSYL